jgi:hypothetical protein
MGQPRRKQASAMCVPTKPLAPVIRVRMLQYPGCVVED